jgi:hypothetical protein
MNKLYASINTELIDPELEAKVDLEVQPEPQFQDIPSNLYAAITTTAPIALAELEANSSEVKQYAYAIPNRLYMQIVPEKPSILAEERIFVYVPKVAYNSAGIAKFAANQFNVINGEVSLKTTYLSELLAANLITPNLILIVDTLPDIGIENRIYLVPINGQSSTGYIWSTSQGWASLGSVTLDLANYYTKLETQNLVTEQLTEIMQILNNIELGIFGLVQPSEEMPTNPSVSIWFEIETEE